MNLFLPQTIEQLYYLIAVVGVLNLIAYIIIIKARIPRGRWLSWGLTTLAVVLINEFTWNEPPFYRMLAIICTLFTGMKIISTQEYFQRSHLKPLSFMNWLAFSLAWFGMNPQVFKQKGSPDFHKGKQMIWYGCTRFLMGMLLVFAVRWLYQNEVIPDFTLNLFILTILLLTGLSLMLHFGILSLCAGIWRLIGFRTYYLFRKPLYATSLREFWGKRWNLAFSEMTSIAIYRPLSRHFPKEYALVSAFLFSGILHEMAISLPVHRGFGLPTLYFFIQAIGQLIEQRIQFVHSLYQHLWVIIWLILPLPLLFHYYFLKEIIWPLIGWHIQ